MKITLAKNRKYPKSYAKLVLIEEKSAPRFVEDKDGNLELRYPYSAKGNLSRRKFITLVRSVVRLCLSQQIEGLYLDFDSKTFRGMTWGEDWFWQTLAENILLSSYEFKRYKTTKEPASQFQAVILGGHEAVKNKKSIDRGVMIGQHVNMARDIANTPGDDMTPSVFANTIKKLASGTKATIKILDEKGIKKEGLMALWAVGKGAGDLPRFVIIEYKGGKKDERPVTLIGKGVTYDTGGLNVKPSGAMHDMHMDMSGGSSVALATILAARLGLKKNIVTLIPVAENAISDRAMRAGDIIQSHSGKTIEVLHTDAEGRLILADALSYSKQYNPVVILDVATLTGAALVALGQQASAVMTEDSSLQNKLTELGEESGDLMWPLPLWDEYKKPLTETRADVVNIQPNFSKWGGAIEGAAFLSFFAPKGIPWAHIDIAPRMESIATDKLAKGSTGEPIRLLIKFLEQY